MRKGFTVHELLISLTIMSAVLALATLFSLRQLGFHRQLDDATTLRLQLEQASETLRNVLWAVAPGSGDLLLAQDSALEIRLATGSSIVCGTMPGALVIAAPTAGTGHGLAAFERRPEPGDRMSAFFSDSTGATWLHSTVTETPASGAGCAHVPTSEAWTLATVQPQAIPSGTPLQFTRPLRLSLYRSSDHQWYLGARDWNGASQQFNAIQPIAGPLLPYRDDETSGLRFTWHGRDGAELAAPVDPARVVGVTIALRGAASGGGASGEPTISRRDSAVAFVRLRNAQ